MRIIILLLGLLNFEKRVSLYNVH